VGKPFWIGKQKNPGGKDRESPHLGQPPQAWLTFRAPEVSRVEPTSWAEIPPGMDAWDVGPCIGRHGGQVRLVEDFRAG
jgi:hypothetical protein